VAFGSPLRFFHLKRARSVPVWQDDLIIINNNILPWSYVVFKGGSTGGMVDEWYISSGRKTGDDWIISYKNRNIQVYS
jgi:hypothetical protein